MLEMHGVNLGKISKFQYLLLSVGLLMRLCYQERGVLFVIPLEWNKLQAAIVIAIYRERLSKQAK